MRQISFSILFFSLLCHNAQACDCLETGSVKTAIRQSAIVVLAKVISQETWYRNGDSGLYVNTKIKDSQIEIQWRYKLIVIEKFNGKISSDTITIITPYGETACGFEFKIGKEYIVYGSSMAVIGEAKFKRMRNTQPNIFETSICSRTREFDKVEIDNIREAIKQ